MTDQDYDKQFMHRLQKCRVVAGSASFVINGYLNAQVTVLRNLLRQAAADGMD
jgi:hypothetical protein